MRIYLVTANAQDHNEYIEYRDQPYNPDSFTDAPMHMGETSYTAGFVSIMGVYTTREQAETRVTKLASEKFPDLRIIEIEADSDCWQFIGGRLALVSKQTIITADHLNATHLGEKIIILDNCEIVMSGKLKELRATQYSMPVYSNDIEAVPDGYGNITIAPKLNYETVTDIIMHLSNQLNDDIKATVHGDTELVIEVNGK